MMECVKCYISDDEKKLIKCPICFKYICEDCGIARSGRWFCSPQCADFFFFGDPDD